MNRFERFKQVKDGLQVLEDIPRFAEEGFESIPDDDLERLKWAGMFHRKPTRPYFMMRIRFASGIAPTHQVRALADIMDRYGRGMGDLTTRQQIEPRWLRIEDMPEVLERLAAAGLTSLQTGMDNIRGVVGCALAGLYPNELLDASPLCRRFEGMFVGNHDFTNLPRKFNVAITGCLDNCTETESQDIALVPAIKETDSEVRGFNVLVGGKMGSGGFTVAQPLDVFVPPEDAAAICRAITLIFRDHGPRESRAHARLAFLIEDWGMERLRTAVEERMAQPLLPAGADGRSKERVDHIGLMPQRQPGLNAVGLLVPVGRVTSGQLREAARLADEYGRGELRLTSGQNLIIPHVPEGRLQVLLAEPLLSEWSPIPPAALRGLVACTGTDFCNLALIDTKARALETARELERRLPDARPLSMRWSGCPAGCGNHHAADIGFQGKRIRLAGGRVVEAVTIYQGGRSGPDAHPGEVIMEDVICDEHLPEVLESIIAGTACSIGDTPLLLPNANTPSPLVPGGVGTGGEGEFPPYRLPVQEKQGQEMLA